MFICKNCELKYAFLNENLCVFCEIIKINKKDNVYNFIICKSNLTQEEIIKKTYEMIIRNDIMPTPTQIDSESIKININPYLFRKYINNDDYKVFFTNCIDRNKIKIKKMFSKYSIEKLNIERFSKGIDLKKIDENTYNQYLINLNI